MARRRLNRRELLARTTLAAFVLTGFPTAADPEPPAQRLGAGFRWSVYGPKQDPGPEYWARVGREMASRFPGAGPEAIWIVSRLKGDGTQLNFPAESGDPLIVGSDQDGNEAAFRIFDELGFRVWLQVEPGNAPVEKLVHLVLDRYARHPCVVGVGVDVEWYKSTEKPEGVPVSDAVAAAWLAAARSHGSEYRLFLKHWEIGMMPPTLREGLLFVDDSQILPSLHAMVEEFAQWGKAFAPAPVAFQFGYPSDRPWWQQLADPPAEIGKSILAAVPNTAALFWVDFTVLEVFPPPGGQRPKDLLFGIKIYERAGELPRLFAEFEDLGFNTLFVSEALASDPEFRGLARERKMAVFVIQPVFYDPDELKKDPGLYAITDAGKPARDDWVAFVCPSRDEYRRRRVEAIASMLTRLEPEGLSLDFIRYFAFWEMIQPDRSAASIPNSCFCARCLERFSRETGVRLPADAATPRAAARWIEASHLDKWTDWKCRIISSMVEDVVRRARQVRPALRVNLHAVPWRADDFGGAIRRIVAQDFDALSKLTDYISPMCYSAMLQRDAAWIGSVVKDLEAKASCPILPSIQVRAHYPGDKPLDAAGFEACLLAALVPPSAGVVFWSWDLLQKAPEAKPVIKRCLRAARSGLAI